MGEGGRRWGRVVGASGGPRILEGERHINNTIVLGTCSASSCWC